MTGPSSSKTHCFGFVVAKMFWNDVESTHKFHVSKNITAALLGKPAIEDLKMLTINKPDTVNICTAVMNTQTVLDIKTNTFVKDFPMVFQGLGKIKGDPMQVELQDICQPFNLLPPQHTLLPFLKSLKYELDWIENMGIIWKIDKPTTCCHPNVIVPKHNGTIHHCLDLTKLNSSIKQELYQFESVAKPLLKLIITVVLWQNWMPIPIIGKYITLEEKSQKSKLITPFGRYCPKRGPFRLSSMPETFNTQMDHIIGALAGVAKSMDNFLVSQRMR